MKRIPAARFQTKSNANLLNTLAPLHSAAASCFSCGARLNGPAITFIRSAEPMKSKVQESKTQSLDTYIQYVSS